jgi:serine/threonine protein kinase
MAPESIKDKEYSFASDVWSFGIFCYEVIAEQEPHADLDVLDAGVRIRDQHLTPTLPEETPQFLVDLVKRCWSVDPAARPSFDEIVTELGEHIKSGDDDASSSAASSSSSSSKSPSDKSSE